MGRLKSRSGCLTCVVRKKKCDETKPLCGHCDRLGLTCAWRQRADHGAVITTTSLRRRPAVPTSISLGYIPYHSELEAETSRQSPIMLKDLMSAIADPSFRNMTIFGKLCAQSQEVRSAIVAFAAYGQVKRSDHAYEQSIISYQNCIRGLQSSWMESYHDEGKRDMVMTAILFLGLLEALRLGDSSICLVHFEVCRKLLSAQLSRCLTHDECLLRLYRIVAECVIFNLAVLAPFHGALLSTVEDWGTAFDPLFDHSPASSPFLGGFHKLYRLMFLESLLLRRTQVSVADEKLVAQCLEQARMIGSKLCELEQQIAQTDYDQPIESTIASLYRAKHAVSVYALRINLIKITRGTAVPSDPDIKYELSRALAILILQDVHEAGNPALCWPLTILACAADSKEDFEFIASLMCSIALIIDPPNQRRLNSACAVLRRYRLEPEGLDNSLDFLLEPRLLAGLWREACVPVRSVSNLPVVEPRHSEKLIVFDK